VKDVYYARANTEHAAYVANLPPRDKFRPSYGSSITTIESGTGCVRIGVPTPGPITLGPDWNGFLVARWREDGKDREARVPVIKALRFAAWVAEKVGGARAWWRKA
jgi:hypothetical protein